MKITFLHTSNSHIERFNGIVEKMDTSIKVKHYVNEELLEAAQKTGKVDKEGFKNELNRIRKGENKFIICTCSTYGDLCDERENTYRIDQPIGGYIVLNYSTIGIAYTFDSTREISKELIEGLANKNGKSIRIVEIDCSHCWNWFEKGNLEKYELEIANQIQTKADNCEAVFLAQASMQGAKNHLTNEKYQVLSSPEFGVKTYLELVKNQKWNQTNR